MREREGDWQRDSEFGFLLRCTFVECCCLKRHSVWPQGRKLRGLPPVLTTLPSSLLLPSLSLLPLPATVSVPLCKKASGNGLVKGASHVAKILRFTRVKCVCELCVCVNYVCVCVSECVVCVCVVSVCVCVVCV